MNIPNIITIVRMLLVPFTVWLIISEAYGAAFLSFMVAGISDGVDGFIARRYDLRTELGAHLDPVADKALLVSIYVTLGFIKVLPAWLVILVVTRDVMIVGAFLIAQMMGRPVKIAPLMVSKINTAAQIILVVLVLGLLELHRDLEPVVSIGMIAVAIFTVASGSLYLAKWFRHMAAGGPRMTFQRQIAFWTGALVALILVLWLLSDILLPFIAGLVLAYFLDPVADALERLGLPRLAATIVILLFSILALVLVLVLILPVLGDQLFKFASDLPGLLTSLAARFNELTPAWIKDLAAKSGTDVQGSLTDLAGKAAGWIVTVLASIWSGGMALVNLVSLMVVTPVVAFYLLADWDDIVARVDSWLPRDHVEEIRQIARDINAAMAGFFRGQGTVCLLLGAFYAIALTFAGLKFGLVIGIVAGLLTFIPYAGAIVGLVLAVGVALVQFWPDFGSILLIAAIFFAGQFIEGNFLSPKLVGKSVGLHPVWLMFALFAFGYIFGFVGLLLAVPLAAAAGVLVRFALARYLASPLYLGRLATPPAKSRRSK